MAKRYNYRLVKIHRNYRIEDIARLFVVHKNTVRQWIKEGLPIIDRKRPILLLGRELSDFLKERQAAKRRPCGLGEMYCFRCRTTKVPAAGMVDCTRRSAKTWNITAICPDCLLIMHQLVSATRFPTFPQSHGNGSAGAATIKGYLGTQRE